MSNDSQNPAPPFEIQVADRLTRLPPYLFGRINAMLYNKRRAGDDVIDHRFLQSAKCGVAEDGVEELSGRCHPAVGLR